MEQAKLPQRKPLRLKGWDYSAQGWYFITICTAQKETLFGSIPFVGARHDSPAVQLSEMGLIVNQTIQTVPIHIPDVSVDKYVVMPNHVHLILQVRGLTEGGRASRASPLRNQSAYAKAVGFIKATASKEIHRQIMKDTQVWQRGSYDHIIRNTSDYRRIWNYIDTNPATWQDDCYYKG